MKSMMDQMVSNLPNEQPRSMQVDKDVRQPNNKMDRKFCIDKMSCIDQDRWYNNDQALKDVHYIRYHTMLGPYTTHPTPILLLGTPYKPTTIIVVPLHQNSYIRDVSQCPLVVVIPLGILYKPRRYSHLRISYIILSW